jgi:hypothetical protein
MNKFNPIMLVERNRLISDLLYSVAKEQPELSQMQLLLIAQQLLSKLTEEPESNLGTLVDNSVDAEAFPDAARFNDMINAVRTDLIDLTKWQAQLTSYAGTFLQDHVGKSRGESSLISLLKAELYATALRTAGLISNEWAINLAVSNAIADQAQTTAYIDSVLQEAMATITTRIKAEVAAIECVLLSPDPNIVHAGFGKKFGVRDTATDDAIRSADTRGVENLTTESLVDAMEYEAVFKEDIKDNPNCPITERNISILQTDPTGSHPINFWEPIYIQEEPIRPVGASTYDLQLQLTVLLKSLSLVDRVEVLQNNVNGYALVGGFGVTESGSIKFDVSTADGKTVMTCPPTELTKVVIKLTKSASYRQRYELYRYLGKIGNSNPPMYTNLLSDKEL